MKKQYIRLYKWQKTNNCTQFLAKQKIDLLQPNNIISSYFTDFELFTLVLTKAL